MWGRLDLSDRHLRDESREFNRSDLRQAVATVNAAPRRDFAWRSSTWSCGRAPTGELAGHHQETRCRVGAGSRRRERPHDMVGHGQRGRQPACDCGRCPMAGRHLLVPDGCGYAEGAQCRPRPAMFDRCVDPGRGRRRRGCRCAGDRARRRGAHCEGVGGQRMAGGTRRDRVGHHCPFNAPSQGPPPWNVYRIEPSSATVVSAAEPGGLTRFRF